MLLNLTLWVFYVLMLAYHGQKLNTEVRSRGRTSSESSRGGSALWEGTKKHQNIRREHFDSVRQSLVWTCRLTRLPWKMGCSPQPILDPRPRRIKTMVKDRTQHVGYLFKFNHLNWNCDIVNILILESFVWTFYKGQIYLNFINRPSAICTSDNSIMFPSS